jgi:inorganic pyrophosphatase
VVSEILCIVEMPTGSVAFPTAYGFVPETLDTDERDPLDVMIAVSEPTFPGCGIVARPVAVLELADQGEHQPKVLCVPGDDPNWQHVNGLADLPDQLIEEIAHFFVAPEAREGHDVEVRGWSSREAAEAVIRQAQERFRFNHPHDDAAPQS